MIKVIPSSDIKYQSKKVKILVSIFLCFALFGVSNTYVYNANLLPFGIGIIFSLLYLKFNGYYLSVIYAISYLLASFSINSIFITLNVVLVLSITQFMMDRKKFKLTIPKLFILSLVSQVLYIICNLSTVNNNLALLISVILGELFLYCALIFLKATFGRGMFLRLNLDEKVCGAGVLIVFMLGLAYVKIDIVNLGLVMSPIILLIFNTLLPNLVVTISVAVGISFSIYSGDVVYISMFVVMGLFALSFRCKFKILSVLGVVVGYIIFNLFFKIGLSTGELLSVLLGSLVFMFVPTKILYKLTEIFQKENDVLIKDFVERSGKMVVSRVKNLSTVFHDMEKVYLDMVKGSLPEDKAKIVIKEELVNLECRKCPNYNECFRSSGSFIDNSLDTIVDVAYEKGKIILVDLPAYLSSNCIRVNDVLTTLNNLINSYFDYSSSVSNLDTSRILIANQLSGVSSLLLTLSRELDVDVSVDKKLQEIIKEELCYRGVICFGCVVYNQDIQNKNISLIVKSDNIVDNIIESVVSKVLNHKVAIVDVSQSDMIGGSVVVLKSAPNYEIVFGVKTIKKTSSKVSGDSYSLLKITDDKYMVSICDGMGSGSSASEISKLTLKLIENFYKAGYDNDIILNSINKLLTLTERENYSTLDLCVLDVRQNVYDFVKLGACESIILRDNGEVEIIESSGLPLGVLENIKPHITRRMINPMDIIVSVSDGIVDSLKGIDLKTFIKNLNIVNPQTLADELVNFALSKNGGVAVDDMTVIVLRLIEKY